MRAWDRRARALLPLGALLFVLMAMTAFMPGASAEPENNALIKDVPSADTAHSAEGSSASGGHEGHAGDAKEGAATHGGTGHNAGGHGADGAHGEEHHEDHGPKSAFTPHHGTWLNPIARLFTGEERPQALKEDHSKYKPGEKRGSEVHYNNVSRDFLTVSFFLLGLLTLIGLASARKARLRPEGKPASIGNLFEAAVEGFQNYLIGIMGADLGRRYTPLIASFFFTILLFNYVGLVPGMVAPTANPNVTLSLGIVGFIMTHIVAVKETGVKSWFMHFIGEPKWMAPLMFPLHVVGELVKPVSLALRLVGNVFGEEMVMVKLIGLAIGIGAMFGLPTIFPFQLPMMFLSLLFGLMQAIVFATLLAIYIATLSTHHDEHDEHNHHGSTEHVNIDGHHQVVAHSSEATLA